uniref:Uncharacterized protein n=1 Tax=Myoviridae sp. ctpiG4 TaxID=2826698 RepID=A0A8S5N2V2_9CAUD|nr:MAG TPA: hypothetical protein [Myoviridae sp. ctpiG4]
MKQKKGVTEMGSNRFMVVSEKDGIIAMNPSYIELKGKNLIIYMPGTYKQLELEYETEDNARDAFVDIVDAYESGKIDVYI